MLLRARASLLALALVLGVAVSAEPASATAVSFVEGTDAAAKLFDPLKISTISLSKASDGPVLNYDNLNTDAYQRANISIALQGGNTVTLNEVGIRLKGQASRGSGKFPLKIKFDEFVKKQKFLGLKRMTLNNMVQDPSWVHEATSYKLFRAMGVPAPRVGYSKVYVQGTYFGLYLNIESIDKTFAKRWFPNTAHIYSGPYNSDVTPSEAGHYVVTIGDTNRTDLNNAAAVDNLQGAYWWNAVQRVADMTRIINLMATDVFTNNWDGYSDAVQNNHSIFFTKDGKFTVIPWGLDQTLQDTGNDNLTWDNSKPNFRGWGNHRSTMWDHCQNYLPCKALFLKASLATAAKAKAIDLLGFETKVAAAIDKPENYTGDLANSDPNTLQWNQGVIPGILNARAQALTTFLMNNASANLPTTIRVGRKVSVALDGVLENDVASTYSWSLNGTPISGATSKTYQVQPSDLTGNLSVAVTLTKTGLTPVTKTSNSVTVVEGVIAKSPTPTIIGKVQRGKTLQTHLGTWDAGVSKSIQWLRNDTPIDGATTASYRLTSADAGSKISVQVTGTATGYATAIRSSQKTLRVR